MSLSDIMSRHVIVGSVSDDVFRISNLMKNNDIGFIPIVSDKKIVGVITDRDIVVRAISNHDYSIDNYISSDIIDVDVSSDLDYVLDVMKKYKVKRVLISDGDKLVGVVSICDFFNCDIDDKVFSVIKDIFEIGPNKYKFESQIDEFYL